MAVFKRTSDRIFVLFVSHHQAMTLTILFLLRWDGNISSKHTSASFYPLCNSSAQTNSIFIQYKSQHNSTGFLYLLHRTKNLGKLMIHGLHQVSSSASYVYDSCLFIDIIMTPLTGPEYIWNIINTLCCSPRTTYETMVVKVPVTLKRWEWNWYLIWILLPAGGFLYFPWSLCFCTATKSDENKLILSRRNTLEMSSILPV